MQSGAATYEALEAEVLRLRARVEELERARFDRDARVPYRAVFDQLPVPVVLYATDGRALAINLKACQLVSVEAESMIEHHDLLQDPEAIASGYADSFRRAVIGEFVQMPATSYDTGTADLDRSNPRTIWRETTYAPVDDGSGERFVLELSWTSPPVWRLSERRWRASRWCKGSSRTPRSCFTRRASMVASCS